MPTEDPEYEVIVTPAVAAATWALSRVWLAGSAHNGDGIIAKGAATNTVRKNFLTEKLVIGLFFIGGI